MIFFIIYKNSNTIIQDRQWNGKKTANIKTKKHISFDIDEILEEY